MNLLTFLQTNNIKSFLDIGANVGDVSNLIKNYFLNMSIFAIEANPNCEIYLKNKNIPYKICCLSDTKKQIEFYISTVSNDTNTGASYYKEKTNYYGDNNYKSYSMLTEKLDDLFDDNQSFDFIKIDTQGSELDIIKGGLNLIKKAKFLMLEVAILEYNEGAPFKNEIEDFLKTINYFPLLKIEEHKFEDGRIFQEDWIFSNNI
jgi:FkbM family methyltransferase